MTWRIPDAPRVVNLLLIAGLLLVTGCATQAPFHTRTVTYAIDEPDRSTLYTRTRNVVEGMGNQSGLRVLENGPDAFAMRALLALRAEQTLDIQYYLVHDGVTTRMLMHLIIEAAERGVRVRVLLDDMATRGRDFATATLAVHPNIEVRLFNPMHGWRDNAVTRSLMMVTYLDRLHRRMHNKLWVTDNAVAIIGGRNLGDEYFGASPGVNFADVDLLSVGPVVGELSASFDEYWNSPNAVPAEAFLTRKPGVRDFRRLRESLQREMSGKRASAQPYLAQLREREESGHLDLDSQMLRWGQARAVWDDPGKVNARDLPPPGQMLASGFVTHMGAIERSFTLVSPYFVPGEDGVAFLSGLAARGVSVSVLTNSLKATDVPFVHGAYAGYRAPLLQAGVVLHEMKSSLPDSTTSRRFGVLGSTGASLHTKAMLFDDDVAFIGSYNFDPRSMFWNTEVGVVVRSRELVADLRHVLDGAFDGAHSYRLRLHRDKVVYDSASDDGVVTLNRTPGGLWRRLQSWVSGALAPETMM